MQSQIQITALHDLTLTPAITDHVHSKFAILEKHSSHINDIHVTLSVDKKFQQNAKGNIHLAGGVHIVAESTTSDMYASIDALVKTLDHQIKKHKEKSQER